MYPPEGISTIKNRSKFVCPDSVKNLLLSRSGKIFSDQRYQNVNILTTTIYLKHYTHCIAVSLKTDNIAIMDKRFYDAHSSLQPNENMDAVKII